MNKKNNKGFSLVELIVVIAVMAVLVVVLAPAYLRYVDKARTQKDESAIAEVVQAVKIAASEEAVSKELVSGAVITIDKDDHTIIVNLSSTEGADETYTPASGDTAGTYSKTTALGVEVRATVGETLEFSSKTYTTADVVIEVTQDNNYNLAFEVNDKVFE